MSLKAVKMFTNLHVAILIAFGGDMAIIITRRHLLHTTQTNDGLEYCFLQGDHVTENFGNIKDQL